MAAGDAARKVVDVPDDEAGPVGPFASWRWVYGTVLLYGVLVIGLLALLTRILDPGTS